MGRCHQVTPTAYYNSSKLCWEVWIEEAQGDRFEKVIKNLNVAHQTLKEQGIRFLEAKMHYPTEALMLVIVDYKYYADNEAAIVDWCEHSSVHYKRTGMVLEFDTQEDRMMFLLRWA
jgi:hypothetical protein